MHRHFATVCRRVMRFSLKSSEINWQQKNGQIWNIVIKCSLFGSLKSINTGDIFNAVVTEEKFAKSER